MIVAPIPSRESARLDALYRSHILDTPSEPAFDELARLAAYVCRTPIAVISLVDATRQWFKSVVGLPYTESPRSTAFCAHTILGTDLFIVEDAGADTRFADHPWVVEPPSIRFYAGVPLITPDGYAIGSLAVMDVATRTLSSEQLACLRTIANQVMAQLELRRAPRSVICQDQGRWNETEDLAQATPDRIARHAEPASVPALCEECSAQNTADALVRESELKFRSIFEQAPVGIATIDSITGRFRRVNSSYCRIMGYTDEEMRSRTFLDITHPDDLQADLDQMTQLLGGDIATFEMDKRLLRKKGDAIWVHLTCVPLWQRPSDPRVHLALVQDISERKQVEERTRHFQNELEQLVESRAADLQRTHRLLQSVIDSSPDWIFVKDREHRFVLVNKAFAASQQLTPADMAGRLDSDFWSAELCEGHDTKGIRGFHADDRRAFAGELIHNPYDPASLHDGTLRIFDTYKGPWHDPDGQIGGVLCYARDVTEQRRAEEIVRQLNSDLAVRIDERTAELARANRLLEIDIAARKLVEARLRESHQFMASILDYLPMTVFVKDAETLRYVHFNRAGEILTGLSKEEVLGKTDHDIFPSEVADSFVAKDQATIDARRIVDVPEEHLLTKDHDAKILHTKKVPILDANGRPRYLLGVAEDITERTRVEGERSKQELLLALMLNTGPGCIKRVAADGTLLHMNPAGLKLIEACGEQEAVGRSVFDLVLPDHRDAFMRMHLDVIGGAARTLQFKVQGFQGTRRWLETHAVPFHNPVTGGTEHLAITYDISERKQAEEALRLSQERLHQALRASNTGLWDWNTESGDVSFSKEWKSQLGFGETELPDSFETWVSRLHPDDRDRAILYTQAYRDHPAGTFRQDFRLRHKDGSYRWIDSHASFVTEPDGRRIRLLGSHTDITERKRAEQALRQSEERFNYAIEATNEGVWDWNITTGTVYFSPQWIRLLGYLPEEVPPSTDFFFSILHPEDVARTTAVLQEHLGGHIPVKELELRLRQKSGEYRWYLDRGKVVARSQDGSPLRMVGTIADISMRKLAEQERARALHSLQIIMETVPDVIFALDLEGRLSQWNTRMEVVTGYGPDELFLKPALELVPLDEAARTSAAITEAFEAGYAELEGHLLAKDGRAIPYHWTGAPFTDLDGRVLGITGVGRDVTERKRAEAALRLTRFSIERAVDAVFWIDAQARILDINDAACTVLGYTRDELLSMTVPDIDPNFPAEAWPAHWAELKARKSFSFETDHMRKDGTVIQTETTVNFLIHEGREYNCAIMRDISARKHTEGLLRFNEERFRLVAEATNDILWDWDLVTGGHWWSPNAGEKFGYDPNAEPDVQAWTERIHPDDRDRVLALVERALASEATSLSEEYRFRLADGSYGHFYDRGQIVRDASGQARRMIGAMIDVTFSKRAYASLETAYQRLQSMSRELQTVESNERRRLSRELHDEVGQLLTGLKFDLEATRQALSDTSVLAVTRARERTLRALDMTDELFARLRRVVRALRPPVLEELGLKEAFEALVSDVQSRSDLACSVSVEGEDLVSPADSAIEAALYRMAQELTTNVVRHAQAMTMSVVLTVDSQYWTLIVQDDGAGFNPNAESISGMGIRGVLERAEILGGRVDFSSTPGAGSTATVWIPVAAAGLSGEDPGRMWPGGRRGLGKA